MCSSELRSADIFNLTTANLQMTLTRTTIFPLTTTWYFSLTNIKWAGVNSRLFSAVSSDRTRGNAYRSEHRKFHRNMRINFFPVRVGEHWHKLPWEVVDFPSLAVLKSCLDSSWNPLQGTALAGIWTSYLQKFLPNPVIPHISAWKC